MCKLFWCIKNKNHIRYIHWAIHEKGWVTKNNKSNKVFVTSTHFAFSWWEKSTNITIKMINFYVFKYDLSRNSHIHKTLYEIVGNVLFILRIINEVDNCVNGFLNWTYIWYLKLIFEASSWSHDQWEWMILLFDISWVLDTVGIMLVDIAQPGMSTSNQTSTPKWCMSSKSLCVGSKQLLTLMNLLIQHQWEWKTPFTNIWQSASC